MTENNDRTDAPQRSRQTHGFKSADRSSSEQAGLHPPDKGHASGNEAVVAFRRQLDEHGARTIQLAYSDLLGRSASLLVPAADCQRALSGVPLTAEAFSGVDTVSAVPDMRTLRFLPLAGSTATLARLACDLRFPDGEPSELCPRSCLKRILEALHRAGLSARASLHCLLPTGRRAGRDLTLACDKALADLGACRVPGLTVGLAEDADSTVANMGAMPLLDAVDLVPVVRAVFGRALSDVDASASLGVSGISLTIHRGKRNLFSDQPANKGAAAAFLGGTGIHAAGLSALLRPMLSGMPSRLAARPAMACIENAHGWRWERGWAAGLGICHVETGSCIAVSGLDGTGSLSLMLTGLIAAGLDGLRRAGGADAPDPAYALPECPADPGLALAALTADECLRNAVGAQTVEAYAASLRARRERRWMAAEQSEQ